MKTVEGLLYTKEHEWIRIEDSKVYMGITDFAQHALGNIVFVELPEVDDEIEEGNTVATIESVKAASDAYIPVTGKILEINEEIVDSPELLNEDPYENWMVCFETEDMDKLKDLLSKEDYDNFCSEEA